MSLQAVACSFRSADHLQRQDTLGLENPTAMSMPTQRPVTSVT